MTRNRYAAALVPLALLLLGCGPDGPPTHSVWGAVTYNGQPLADAQIGFVPAEGQVGLKPARGQTDAQGRYTLQTYIKPGQDVKGAMAGRFQVTIEKGLAQNEIVEYEDLVGRPAEIPPKYADVTTTPLTAEVTAGGDNQFNFTLDQTP